MANTDFNFDFGFSAMDADELEVVQAAKDEVKVASSTASDLENVIDLCCFLWIVMVYYAKVRISSEIIDFGKSPSRLI